MDTFINGLKIDINVSKEDMENVFFPLVLKLKELQKSQNKKIIVALAGIPGAGKSVFAKVLESCDEAIQTIGLDGFHYPEDYLIAHDLKARKGASFTFDTDKLKEKMDAYLKGDSLWPIYDRNLHDVVEDVISIDKKILLIEGNYLLLNQKPWNELFPYYTYTIFLKTDVALIKERIIQRKEKGKISKEAALCHFKRNDALNIQEVLLHSIEPDCLIEYIDHYTISRTSIKS